MGRSEKRRTSPAATRRTAWLATFVVGLLAAFGGTAHAGKKVPYTTDQFRRDCANIGGTYTVGIWVTREEAGLFCDLGRYFLFCSPNPGGKTLRSCTAAPWAVDSPSRPAPRIPHASDPEGARTSFVP